MLFFITITHIDNVILYYNDTYRQCYSLFFITMIHYNRQCYIFITMIHIDNVILYYNDTYRQCYSLLQ